MYLLIIVITLFIGVFSEINITAYRQMPPLYNFKDYDLCLHRTHFNHTGTYCIVYSEIVTYSSSSLWQYIESFSSDHKKHYRHDHLFFGICIEHCKEVLNKSEHNLAETNISDKNLVNYYNKVYTRNTDNRLDYSTLANDCVNMEFSYLYDLKLRTNLVYCEKNNEPLNQDACDIAFFIVLTLIGFLNISSSLYDYILKRRLLQYDENNDFYKNKPQTKVDHVLTSFSIYRNYYRLMAPATSNTIRNLRFFHLFRVVGVFIVIFVHTLIYFISSPVSNTEFFEQLLDLPEISILQNVNGLIQIFFIMSSFFMYVKIVEKNIISKDAPLFVCIKLYFQILFNRYLRIVPTVILLVLFNSTLLVRLQDGPFWRHNTEPDRTFCRKYWWKNVFLINNYALKESCAHHTWYIAADMQLFQFFLIILIFMVLYPTYRTLMLIILLHFAVLIPALITYFLKLDATYYLSPENYRHMYFKDADAFYYSYIPFYTNLGGYIFGFLCGIYYLNAKQSTNGVRDLHGIFKYEIAWFSLLPLSIGLLFTGSLFMFKEIEKPSILASVYAGLYRNLWCILFGAFIIGACHKLGDVIYKFASLPIFRTLSRMSYQSYIWHIMIIHMLTGYHRQPLYVNKLLLFSYINAAIVFTQIFSFMMVILFELPISENIKLAINILKSQHSNPHIDVNTEIKLDTSNDAIKSIV